MTNPLALQRNQAFVTNYMHCFTSRRLQRPYLFQHELDAVGVALPDGGQYRRDAVLVQHLTTGRSHRQRQ